MRVGSVGFLSRCLVVIAALGACSDDPGEETETTGPPGTSTTELGTTTAPTTSATDDPSTDATTGTAPLCGNGEVDPGEACDDGNVDNTDYCIEDCVLAVCGDGFVQAGLEQCDDANTDADDSCLPGCYAAVCGDGHLYAGVEQCDDGNQVDADDCRNDCTPGEDPPQVCGNGVPEPGEQCDDGNQDNSDNCVGACAAWACGDGYVHAVFETCDDGNPDNHDACVDVGGSCVDASCGDGYLYDGVEECDDGNLSDGDDCLNTCFIAACGDGVLHVGVEVCDDGVNDGAYDGCNPDCLSLAPHCGDGVLDVGFETCDDGNLMPGDGCDAACQAELPPECLGYTELKEADRAVSFNDGPGKVTKCDKTMDKWHRFASPAGTVMPLAPPLLYSCGTDSPGWMQGDLPLVDDGIVARTACFAWEGDPCTWTNEIQVRNCGEYYVFKLPNPPEDCLRYCAAPN